MYNCSQELIAFHNDEVKLSASELKAIRDRRDMNRRRILRGLNYYGKPSPYDFYSQGSYAMKTMIRHEENDYDIDDGIYFNRENLEGPRGGEMSALEAKKIVWWAIHNNNFNTPPEYLKNCVRVYYNEGYCIDVPVYRRFFTANSDGSKIERIELASTNWKRSDARKVTAWFEDENKRQSPDDKNGRQMRRICRLLKKFARSRESWKGRIASGFVITKLAAECFRPVDSRDDIAFYQTSINIYQRLEIDLIVRHPINSDEIISNGKNDAKIRFFKDKLYDAIARLIKLTNSKMTEKSALHQLNQVFKTDYFIQ